MEPDYRRVVLANVLLAAFVICPAIGFFMLAPWAGFVAFGVTSGVAAFLLGADTDEETA